MKSCIDIRSSARDDEGAVLVILGIAKKRDAAGEEKERLWCWLEHEREHAQTSAKTVEHRSCSHANPRSSVESGVNDNIALAGTLFKGSHELTPSSPYLRHPSLLAIHFYRIVIMTCARLPHGEESFAGRASRESRVVHCTAR